MSALKKNKGGRPKKKLGQKELIELEALSSALSVDQIADYFGIGRTCFYEILKRQPEVNERYKKGRAKVVADIAEGLIQSAIDGDNTARIFYLKTQAGWKETVKNEHSGVDGKAIETISVEVTDKEAAKAYMDMIKSS